MEGSDVRNEEIPPWPQQIEDRKYFHLHTNSPSVVQHVQLGVSVLRAWEEETCRPLIVHCQVDHYVLDDIHRPVTGGGIKSKRKVKSHSSREDLNKS